LIIIQYVGTFQQTDEPFAFTVAYQEGGFTIAFQGNGKAYSKPLNAGIQMLQAGIFALANYNDTQFRRVNETSLLDSDAEE
jgi:hypothetical protein